MAVRSRAIITAIVVVLILMVVYVYGAGMSLANTGISLPGTGEWKISNDVGMSNIGGFTKISPGALINSGTVKNPSGLTPGTVNPNVNPNTLSQLGSRVKQIDPGRIKSDPGFIDPGRLKKITPPKNTPPDNLPPEKGHPQLPLRPVYPAYPGYDTPSYVQPGIYYPPNYAVPGYEAPYSQALPDLEPLPKYEGKAMGGAGYANFDNAGNFIIRVRDNGAPCGASMVTVNFGNTQVKGAVMAFERGYGDINDAIVKVPSGVWNPDAPFTITVDSDNAIAESNENNNVARGVALG